MVSEGLLMNDRNALQVLNNTIRLVKVVLTELHFCILAINPKLATSLGRH